MLQVFVEEVVRTAYHLPPHIGVSMDCALVVVRSSKITRGTFLKRAMVDAFWRLIRVGMDHVPVSTPNMGDASSLLSRIEDGSRLISKI